jgi:LemA protein
MTSWILLAIIVVVALVGVGAYNRLVSLRQRCRQSFSDIDVQLKQRHDLVLNLVETVKGYAAHEKDTLQAVVAARNAAVGAQGSPNQAQAEGQLSAALGRLIALSEAYPDLKANQSFVTLQTQLATIEDKIAAARRFFNNSAAEFNAAREAFPAVLFAASLGFAPQTFFELEASERANVSTAPVVKF